MFPRHRWILRIWFLRILLSAEDRGFCIGQIMNSETWHPEIAAMKLVPIFLAIVCAGCAVGPKYHTPDVPTPPAYKEQQDSTGNVVWKTAAPNDSALRGNWWEMFNDQQLNALEGKVASANQNVAVAEARFRQAAAAVAYNRANYYPVVSANPSITTSQSSASLAANRTGVTRGTLSTFFLPFSVSWEPDFWGRIRLSVQNASAQAQASAADIENMKLSLQAELATDYFQMQSLDMEARVLDDTIAA
jgi:outer membrane protein TolC